MNNVFLYTHRPSNGARDLAKALEIKRIRVGVSSYQPRPYHTIINWGSSNPGLDFAPAKVLNRPEMVGRSSNKLTFFQHLRSQESQVRVPPWTVDPTEAQAWAIAGDIVVARGTLTGHSGQGITIIEAGVDFVSAPLYTKYIKKEAEYRVHCIRQHDTGITSEFGPFDVQRKIKDPAFEGTPNWRVRNHHNGFIYIRDNIQIPQDVTRQAVLALASSGLDFGAVDVIWNGHEQRAYVLEINTAPGLVGRSLGAYKDALERTITGH